MLNRVMLSATRHRQLSQTEFQVEIDKNTIRVVRDVKGNVQYDETFNKGDMAEYEHLNLRYYGPILSISDNTVTIISRHDVEKHANGEKVKKHRLTLYKFCCHNYDFVLEDVIKSNSQIYM